METEGGTVDPAGVCRDGDDPSFSGDDSNVIVLTEKRKKKMKAAGKSNNTANTLPRLSKSKERKLRQIQEENKRKNLESKSIMLLKKYKIHDDAYPLLQSSGTIGQVGSSREKRLLAMHFTKAGLEVPEDIKHFKKKGKLSTDHSDAVSWELHSGESHLEKSVHR